MDVKRASATLLTRWIQTPRLPKYLSSDHDPLYKFHQWQANSVYRSARRIAPAWIVTYLLHPSRPLAGPYPAKRVAYNHYMRRFFHSVIRHIYLIIGVVIAANIPGTF
jgi:hypothetical protein